MHPNAQRIEDFYAALERGDGAAMASAYAPDASFRDPVFSLRGDEIAAMWKMFCEAPGDVAVTVTNVEADDERGRAHWEPVYRFGRAGRRVHNRVDADFRFDNGLIIDHRDSFPFWRWSRQALGAPGLLFGWSRLLRRRVQAQADARIRRFQVSMEGDGSV